MKTQIEKEITKEMRDFTQAKVGEYAESVIESIGITDYPEVYTTEGGAQASTYISAEEAANLSFSPKYIKIMKENLADYLKIDFDAIDNNTANEELQSDYEYYEQEFLALVEMNIQLYDGDNGHSDSDDDKCSCYVSFFINFESPYYRSAPPKWLLLMGGKDMVWEWCVSREFPFDNLDDLKEKLPKEVEQLKKDARK